MALSSSALVRFAFVNLFYFMPFRNDEVWLKTVRTSGSNCGFEFFSRLDSLWRLKNEWMLLRKKLLSYCLANCKCFGRPNNRSEVGLFGYDTVICELNLKLFKGLWRSRAKAPKHKLSP